MATTRAPRASDEDGRRRQLVDAAARVIASEGVASTTTRKIAAEAGVPTGLVHYWFSGKDELLEEVITSLLQEVEQSAQRSDDPEPAPERDIAARFENAFDRVVKTDERGRQIAIYELTTWSLRSPEREHLARQQYQAYRATASRLTQSIVDGLPEGGTVDHDTLAQFVSALFDGVTLAWLADSEGTNTHAIFELAGTLLSQLQSLSR